MTTEELIKRINELSAKNRETGLTDEELAERATLRAEYICRFRESLTASLESVRYIGEDGREHKLQKKQQITNEREDDTEDA